MFEYLSRSILNHAKMKFLYPTQSFCSLSNSCNVYLRSSVNMNFVYPSTDFCKLFVSFAPIGGKNRCLWTRFSVTTDAYFILPSYMSGKRKTKWLSCQCRYVACASVWKLGLSWEALVGGRRFVLSWWGDRWWGLRWGVVGHGQGEVWLGSLRWLTAVPVRLVSVHVLCVTLLFFCVLKPVKHTHTHTHTRARAHACTHARTHTHTHLCWRNQHFCVHCTQMQGMNLQEMLAPYLHFNVHITAASHRQGQKL